MKKILVLTAAFLMTASLAFADMLSNLFKQIFLLLILCLQSRIMIVLK